MKEDSVISRFFRMIEVFVFYHPKTFLSVILLATAFFATRVPYLEMYSNFADLLPQEHPYIQLHNDVKDTFGGANNVVMAISVEEGDIFNSDTLSRIHRLTLGVDSLPGVNHNLVRSLTHRTVRKTWLTELGNMNSEAYYDPLYPDMTEEQLKQLRLDVMANPTVYGLLVSPDLKSALIRGTFNEGQLDYVEIFRQLGKLKDDVEQLRATEVAPGVHIYATGQPVLMGWVYSYLNQIMQIFFLTLAILLALLVLYFRSRLYGIVLPLIGVLISATWGLGIVALLGYNLDPLTLVIPFLITARAMSHGIQLVERYYQEAHEAHDNHDAARRTFETLFRPGTLGIVSDAVGLLLISLGSSPINVKLGIYASIWAGTVVITVLIAVPLVLSLLPLSKVSSSAEEDAQTGVFASLARVVTSSRGSAGVLLLALVVYIGGGVLSSRVQIGESEPGSPILYPDHDYNVSSQNINDNFPGSEEMYIVARTSEPGGIKRPEVLRALEDLQIHMLKDPEMGGSKGMPDLVKQVNRILHNDDPRWSVIPDEASYVGGLMFAFMASSPIPGALKEFVDTDEQTANLVFFYKDHKGETLRRAIHMAKEWIEDPANQVEGLEVRLAGGPIGVTAAINEAAFESNIVIIPAAMALIFLFVTLFYWSLHAGWLMFLVMTFCTVATYAYMGIVGIGIDVNTVPIIAVGIGVGIDYSIYMMDRIREETARLGGDLEAGIRLAIATTGKAIAFTATALIGGVVMWAFVSDLRFQADAALLLVVMLILNAWAAANLVPAWIVRFRPAFIVKAELLDDEIHAEPVTAG
ncbi:MAG: MMPL family transporter [Halieaceae bacterium]|uniref:efflux RND transporter permease subunit n=1 Tax=Haliea alexandrii TaxID=2448162 RepID=UPI001E5E061F|nr:MMPL family transporter [Haliea alexandrii]MCR9186303.1 MMPL family transporter [Halieaceae bacterium]